MQKYQRSRLDNGMLVISETEKSSHAVCLGIGIRVGVTDESIDINGISHFIEHMVFKGTKSYSAFDISHKIENLGGDINAYTARDLTCYHVTLLKQDYKTGLKVLAELVQSAKFQSSEMEKEKAVILQEIAMTNDNPEDYIFDVFYEKFYGKQPVGLPILGTEKSLLTITQKNLLDYYKTFYRPENLFVVATGGINHKALVKEVNKLFPKKADLQLLPKRPDIVKTHPFVKKQRRSTEQVHILLGCPISNLKDGIFYEASIVNTYLAGGMTSKLYQELREKRGLCYSVFSMFMPLETSGLLLIYTATDSKHALKAIDTIIKELQHLLKNGLSAKEVSTFRKQLMGSFVLNSDDIENRMNTLLMDAMLDRKYRTLENMIKSIGNIKKKSIDSYLKKYLDLNKLSLFAVGNIKPQVWSKIEKRVMSVWNA